MTSENEHRTKSFGFKCNWKCCRYDYAQVNRRVLQLVLSVVTVVVVVVVLEAGCRSCRQPPEGGARGPVLA